MDATDLDDPYQTCPYDESHRILKSRMQWHLVRCRKNHPCDKSKMKVCPYDATHVVQAIEYACHVSNCPKSGSVLNFVQSSEGQRCVGSVSLEEIKNAYSPVSAENWENDPPAPKYDPLKEARNKGVLLFEVGLSKAKKRQFKNSERLRIRALEESGVIHNPGPKSKPETESAPQEPNKPLRHPVRKPSKSLSVASAKDDDDLVVMNPLRPPRSKSIALSVCSNDDYMEESLSKHFNSSLQLDAPHSLNKNPTNLSNQSLNSQTLFDSIIEDANRKSEQMHASNLSINLFNPDFKGGNMMQSEGETSAYSSSLFLNDAISSSSFQNLSNGMHSKNMNADLGGNQSLTNPSNDAIKEINSRLAVLDTLEKSLEEEKAKLKRQVDEYYSSGSSRSRKNSEFQTSMNSRCAANFSNAK